MEVNTKAIEKEILDLENKYWQAIKSNDAEAALKLSDETSIVTGAQGLGVLTRDSLKQMMNNPQSEIKSFEMHDPKFLVVNDSCAVIAYQVKEHLVVDGVALDFEATDSSTWVKKDGNWVCVLHTEAIKGDPYGRDRRH